MMIMPHKRKMTTLFMNMPKKSEEDTMDFVQGMGEESDSEDEYDMASSNEESRALAKKSAASSIMKALEAKDSGLLSLALSDFIECCEE